ncbi:hypothetical protein FDECE_2481 [Fusarium decemcellulare]|nr:hypothetical protein FDECE_2481 [Fusarium decemcellulare]
MAEGMQIDPPMDAGDTSSPGNGKQNGQHQSTDTPPAPTNNDQDEPPQLPLGQEGGSSSEDSTQYPSRDGYRLWKEARQRHSKDWWGTKHSLPAMGESDRQFLFARNPLITEEEAKHAVDTFNNAIRDEETGELNPLGLHLRPSTPPMERAMKQIDGLKEQGYEVTPELRREIIENYARNSGLIPALHEWCKGKKDVPVAHVRELLAMIDRLKLEMASQLSDASLRYQDLKDNFDDHKRKYRQPESVSNKKSIGEMLDRIQKVGKLDGEGQDDTNSVQQSNTGQRSNTDAEEPSMDRLQTTVFKLCQDLENTRQELSDWKVFGDDNVDMSDEHKAKLAAAEETRHAAEKEVQKYKGFHDMTLKYVEEEVKTWKAMANTGKELDKLDQTKSDADNVVMSDQTKEVVRVVAEAWETLETQYHKEWPHFANSEKLERDIITLKALEVSEKRLLDTTEYNQNVKLQSAIKQQETDYERQQLDTNESMAESDERKSPKPPSDAEISHGQEMEQLRRENQEEQEKVRDEHQKQLYKLQKEKEDLGQQLKSCKSGHEAPNFRSADELLKAIGKKGSNQDGGREPNLMDRINYLNITCFLRTRNFIQLALREGATRLANCLLRDAYTWMDSCREDISTMKACVADSMEASIFILSGLRRFMTARDNEQMDKGLEDLRDAKARLDKYNDDPITFGQLRDLASDIIKWADDTKNDQLHSKRRRLFGDKLSFLKSRQHRELQKKVKDEGSWTAERLKRSGYHSPVSPKDAERIIEARKDHVEASRSGASTN